METPLSTPSPISHSVPLPVVKDTKPISPSNAPSVKSRKPSIFASAFSPPNLDSDIENGRLDGVQEEDDDDSDMSEIDSDGGKNIRQAKTAKDDDEDDDLSEVDEDEPAKENEDAEESRESKAARRLSSTSKGKPGVGTSTGHVNGQSDESGDVSDGGGDAEGRSEFVMEFDG
jgi:hypothetical protein